MIIFVFVIWIRASCQTLDKTPVTKAPVKEYTPTSINLPSATATLYPSPKVEKSIATPTKIARPTLKTTSNPGLSILGDIDGGMIAFVSNMDGDNEICVMILPFVEGETPTTVQLTNNEDDDVLSDWSPDGSQFAFSSDRDGDWEIYVMNTGGTDVRQLTDNTITDSKPSWSPDGTKIIFDSGAAHRI